MDILSMIANDSSIGGEFKKLIKGEQVDRVNTSSLKDLILLHINGLKEKNLWWEEDEKLFQDKYGISSDDAYKKIREGE